MAPIGPGALRTRRGPTLTCVGPSARPSVSTVDRTRDSQGHDGTIGNALKTPSPYFVRTINALRMVAPLCIAARYDDGFKHCVEASVAGANALKRRRGIKARAIPCAVVVQHAESDVIVTIGFAPRQIYDRLPADDRRIIRGVEGD